MDITYINQRWHSLTSKVDGNQLLIKKYWEILDANHREKQRHYHTWDHVEKLLKHSEIYSDLLWDATAIDFAIFYHDAIYIPKRNNNEEKSALLAKQHLEKLAPNYARIVSNMILATKKHERSEDHDTNLLLDFDLAIIGSQWKDYELYTQQIRNEYSIYPDFLYRPGRKKVLQSFLDQSHIFKTELFQDKFEKQARRNIQKEISSL